MTDLSALKRDAIAYADDMGFDDQPNPTPIPGLSLVRSRGPTEFDVIDYQPIFCLVLQGAKQCVLGDKPLTFSEGQSLIVSLDLPASGRVVTASRGTPYLALALELDLAILRDVAAELDAKAIPTELEADHVCSAMTVTPTDPALVAAMGRLFDLHRSPEDARALAPLVIREIHYRLLRSRDGVLLKAQLRPDTHAHRIARAIARIRRDYSSALRVPELARDAGMSHSAFHEHFRALTGTTPLQYQKSMRLMEARRQLQGGAGNVSSIAFAVGYESPTQFSREYSRKFGVSPRTDRLSTSS
ncbi:AraC family transcriptional regulator [Maricaulis sp.]|uniref:AraC family transcriptional regulator n=1 Tax=Maricaulis sp. TaxID=1486257 RepID=UPI0026311941|nr:AraC family transcriptional regulator [Maricaulis sp.]